MAPLSRGEAFPYRLAGRTYALGGAQANGKMRFRGRCGHPVRITAVPRETWESLFRSQAMKNPIPRIQMLDGFNEGWIEFEQGERGSMKGEVTLETVLRGLIEATSTFILGATRAS